jgi:hypothetical protein
LGQLAKLAPLPNVGRAASFSVGDSSRHFLRLRQA